MRSDQLVTNGTDYLNRLSPFAPVTWEERGSKNLIFAITSFLNGLKESLCTIVSFETLITIRCDECWTKTRRSYRRTNARTSWCDVTVKGLHRKLKRWRNEFRCSKKRSQTQRKVSRYYLRSPCTYSISVFFFFSLVRIISFLLENNQPI